jgi:hypothetical protein
MLKYSLQIAGDMESFHFCKQFGCLLQWQRHCVLLGRKPYPIMRGETT